MLVSWKRREEFNRRPPLGSPLTALGHAPGPSHNWIPGRGWERSDKAGENFHTKAHSPFTFSLVSQEENMEPVEFF